MADIKLAGGGHVKMHVRDLRGKRVRTLRALTNHNMTVPAGTVVTVTSWWRSGVNIMGPGCAACGVQARVHHVHRDDIELLERPAGA